MEVNFARPARHLASDVLFLGLCCLTWLLSFVAMDCSRDMPGNVLLLFALGASVYSLLVFRALGKWSPLRVLPRKSDLALVLFAVCSGGVLQYLLFSSVFHVQICSFESIVCWAPMLSLFIFGLHYVCALLVLHTGRPKKIVLDVLPNEREELERELKGFGLERYFRLLSVPQLSQHLLRRRADDIEMVIISRGAVKHFDADAVLLRAHLAGVPIVDHRKLVNDLTGRIQLEETDLWTYMHGATKQTPMLRAFSHVKTIIEPSVAVFLGLLLLPIMGIIALLIKLTSRGPILFRQVRTGYLGRTFTLYKFRSMYQDAERDGPQWAKRDDRRVTPLGRLLRRTRLDELPQLWNVVRGDMSFFGPRPERPEIYRKLKREIPLFSMRTVVRPGITGWAQVCAGYAGSVEESREKLEFDLYYIQHMSPRLDLIILVKTLVVALLGGREHQVPQPVRFKRTVLEVSSS